VCGNHLDVGDLVKFKVMMSLVEEEEEVVINVIKIRYGNETWLDGFLRRHIGYGSQKDKLRNKYAQVLELNKESADFTKKRRNRCRGAH
jgi:predicted acetyltransferase